MRPADERALRLAPARAGERRGLRRGDHYGLLVYCSRLVVSSVVRAGREVDADDLVVALLDVSGLLGWRRAQEAREVLHHQVLLVVTEVQQGVADLNASLEIAARGA